MSLEAPRGGSCEQMPYEAVDEFFFDAVAVNAVSKISWARRICADCPVVEECRDYGLETNPPYGLLGGLTPKDRERYLSGDAA